MAKRYEAPYEVRELEKLINNFTYTNGLEVTRVFQDFLRYIIHGFSLPGTPPLEDWRYTKEQNKAFVEMLSAWIGIMNTQIKRHGWYDSFGDLFMALTSQRGQQQKGQFFTPKDVCQLASEITMEEDSKVKNIYDPAAGSGRMLLAVKARHPRNFLVAWDIDYTCCLMCVCNFLINSCVGEVVCIDTLRMDNFRGAWLVNEAYYRTGLPSVRFLNEREYILYQRADIPPYVYFFDQERYDDYIKIREMWAAISSLIHSDAPTDKSPESLPEIPEKEIA